MIKQIIWLVLVIVISLSMPVLAAEPAEGTIEGRLVNGTRGGAGVANQEITLRTYQNYVEIGPATIQTDTAGNFVFKNITTTPDYIYQVTTTFQEAEYVSEITGFRDNESIKSIELTVYDSTTSDEAISVVNAHTVVYTEQGSLKVEEFYLIANMSDRTYVGSGEVTSTGKRKTLSFPLPNPAADLQYGGDLISSYILQDENGFIDTMPVLPGSKQIVYSYHVDYSSDIYTLSHSVNYPTFQYNLLVQGENIKVASDRLTREETINIDGNVFTNLSAGNLGAGDTVITQLSGLSATSKPSAILWVGLALILLSAGGITIYLVRRKKYNPIPVDNELAQQQKLLAEIAQLDDDFEKGAIIEEPYRKLRNEKKTELLKLMQKEKDAD